MALTMVSLINSINNIAERDQYRARDINFVVDEAHIVTVNPLLSPLCNQSGENVAETGGLGCGWRPRTSMTIRTVPRKCSIWRSGGCV